MLAHRGGPASLPWGATIVLALVFGAACGPAAISGSAAGERRAAARPDTSAPLAAATRQGTMPPSGSRAAGAPEGAPATPGERAALRVTTGARSIAEGGACPSDMVLVEGGWCPTPQRLCLKGWHDPALRRTVCLEYGETRCEGTATPVRTCMERREHPGTDGATPTRARSAVVAQLLCAERGRRLCTEQEWVAACEGPTGDPYPTGRRRDPSRCGLDRARRLPGQPWPGVTAVAVDALPECGPAGGVIALAGNLPEWVAAVDLAHLEDEALDALALGGDWWLGERNECRSRRKARGAGAGEEPHGAATGQPVGFRCCAEPSGAAADPLTPRQRARGWSRERLERLRRSDEGEEGPSPDDPEG